MINKEKVNDIKLGVKLNNEYVPSSAAPYEDMEFTIKSLGPLPDEYIEFLTICDGGVPEDYPSYQFYNAILEKHASSDISCLYGIKRNNDTNELINANSEDSTSSCHNSCIAIGEDGLGNRLMLDRMSGKVYLHDLSWEDSRDKDALPNNYHLIADNFSDFIDNLYEEELSDEDDKEIDSLKL